MRKRAQHEVLHIVLTFLNGREPAVLSVRQVSQNFWLHRSLVTDGTVTLLATDAHPASPATLARRQPYLRTIPRHL